MVDYINQPMVVGNGKSPDPIEWDTASCILRILRVAEDALLEAESDGDLFLVVVPWECYGCYISGAPVR
jgi:hypothetical protein